MNAHDHSTTTRDGAIGIASALLANVPLYIDDVKAWLQVLSLAAGAGCSIVMLWRLLRKKGRK